MLKHSNEKRNVEYKQVNWAISELDFKFDGKREMSLSDFRNGFTDVSTYKIVEIWLTFKGKIWRNSSNSECVIKFTQS